MPTQWAHSFYWNFSDTNVAPVAPTGRGGYPGWQAASVASGVVFGPPLDLLGQVWARLVSWLRWCWAGFGLRDRERILATAQRIAGQGIAERAVLEHAIVLMNGPHWGQADRLVRETATTLGFNRPEAWIPYGRALKASPGQAENTFRHLRTVHELKKIETTSTISNPDAHLLVELAYHRFTVAPRDPYGDV